MLMGFLLAKQKIYWEIPISIIFNKQVMNWVFRASKKDTGNPRILPDQLVKTFTRNCDLTGSSEDLEQLTDSADTSPEEISLSP